MTASQRAYSPNLTGPRRIMAIGWLFAYLVSTIGVPLPASVSQATPIIALAACGCSLDAEARGTCCCAKALPSSSVPSCCSMKNRKSSAAASAQAAKPRGVRGLAFAARKCQGHADSWLTAAMAVPLARPVDSLPIQFTGRVVIVALLIPVVFADPPVPPPRLAHFCSAA